MNWWYRDVFIDRNFPITSTATHTQQPDKTEPVNGLYRALSRLFDWVKTKYQENAQLRYDWKIYKNLSDHQLEDIGLTRDDLHLLLRGKKPVYPYSYERLKKANASKVINPDTRLPSDADLGKPDLSSCRATSGNDCGEQAA